MLTGELIESTNRIVDVDVYTVDSAVISLQKQNVIHLEKTAKFQSDKAVQQRI